MASPTKSDPHLAQPHLVMITLGSNIRPEESLPAAVRKLSQLGRIRKVASVWESAPVGDTNQARFCNSAALLSTHLEVDELKSRLREIESELGRQRDPLNKNAARTIDLDIAIYDHLIRQDEHCCIPDPEIESRPFLAVPLAELDPDFIHPLSNQSLKEIASEAGGTATLTHLPALSHELLQIVSS